MVLLNMECKKSLDGVTLHFEIQGENGYHSDTLTGQNVYEALGKMMANLIEKQSSTESLNPEFKITWVHSSPQTQELTVIQEFKDGAITDVRWGTNLFTDLFKPIYTSLKNM